MEDHCVLCDVGNYYSCINNLYIIQISREKSKLAQSLQGKCDFAFEWHCLQANSQYNSIARTFQTVRLTKNGEKSRRENNILNFLKNTNEGIKGRSVQELIVRQRDRPGFGKDKQPRQLSRERQETSNANSNGKEQKHRWIYMWRASSPPKVLPGPAARSTFSSEHRSMFCPG